MAKTNLQKNKDKAVKQEDMTVIALTNRMTGIEVTTATIADNIKRHQESIEKLSEISAGIKEMLAAQENRIENQENAGNILYQLAEKRQEEYHNNSEKVNAKFEIFTRELHEVLNKVSQDRKNDTTDLIESFRREISQNTKDLEASVGRVEKELQQFIAEERSKYVESRQEAKDVHDNFERRLKNLERAKWTGMGILLVIITVFKFVNLSSILLLIQHFH